MTPAGDTVAVTTARSVAGELRVDGTSTIPGATPPPDAPTQVVVYARTSPVSDPTGTEPGWVKIGSAAVDAAGAFSVRPSPAPDVAYVQYLMQTSRGTLLTGPLGAVAAAPTGPVAPRDGPCRRPTPGFGGPRSPTTRLWQSSSKGDGERIHRDPRTGVGGHTGAQEHHMKIPSRTGVTAGVTTGPPPDERPRGRRRAVVAGLVATGLVSSSLILPGIAAAAVPAFPDNIVVFPDRDFVTVEGFQDHVGKTGDRRGHPRRRRSSAPRRHVVDAGDVAFEINHPGGYCWGAGHRASRSRRTSTRATRSSIKIDGDRSVGDTIAGNACVTADAVSRAASTLTVTGKIGGRREPGPDRAANRQPGPHGHRDRPTRRPRAARADRSPRRQGRLLLRSELHGDTFTATYVFIDPATPRSRPTPRSASGSMSWQVEDADGNRQGLTIAEFGERAAPAWAAAPPVRPTRVRPPRGRRP